MVNMKEQVITEISIKNKIEHKTKYYKEGIENTILNIGGTIQKLMK